MKGIVLALFFISGCMVGADGALGQQPCPPDNPCGGIPRFAEYGNIRESDERAVLDHLAKQLRMSPVQTSRVDFTLIDDSTDRQNLNQVHWH